MVRLNSLRSRFLRIAANGVSPICLQALLLLAALPSARADVIRPSDSLPPMDGVYRDPAEIHADFDDGTVRILLRRPEHRKFDRSSPPPQVIGETTTHTFGSIGFVEMSLDGVTWQPFSAPVSSSVDVTFVNQVGAVRQFSTQMTVFDIVIGPRQRIRQSPDNPSLGATEIETLADGNFRIGSFFDLNLELTLTGGETWIPSSVTGRVTLEEP